MSLPLPPPEFQLFDRVRVRAPIAYRAGMYPPLVGVVTRLSGYLVSVHYPNGIASVYYPEALEHVDDEA